jgi:tripartite-type tricarboxylate transporter receptor subunit TctC
MRNWMGGVSRRGLIAAGAGLALARPAVAQAPAWPDKPVRLIVGFGPGGVTDVAARLLADALRQQSGQPVIVENRPGANGVLGANLVARSAPDGNTILVAPGTMTLLPVMMRNLPLDVLKDLDPISLFLTSPNVLLVNRAFPAQDFASFLSMVRARPPEDVPAANSGTSTTVYFFARRIEAAAGIQLRHIPYNGSAASIAAVVAGEVPVGVSAVNAALPFIQGGQVRALAVGSPQRSSFLPNVPTFAEVGFPDFRSDTWISLMGPAGMPPALVSRIGDLAIEIFSRPSMQERLAALGAEPVRMRAAEFRDLLAREVREFREVAAAANIQPE